MVESGLEIAQQKNNDAASLLSFNMFFMKYSTIEITTQRKRKQTK